MTQIEPKPDIFPIGLMWKKRKKNTAIMDKKTTFIKVDFTKAV